MAHNRCVPALHEKAKSPWEILHIAQQCNSTDIDGDHDIYRVSSKSFTEFRLKPIDSGNMTLLQPVISAAAAASTENVIVQPNTASFRKTFFSQFPGLRGFDMGDNIAIAGSSVAHFMSGSPSNWTPGDVDIFFYGVTDLRKADDCIRSLGEHLSAYHQREGPLKIRKFKHVLTLWNHKVKYQIILKLYRSVSDILHGFDIGVCQFAFADDDLHFTSAARYALETGYNIIDTSKMSATYVNRLIKYFERGYGIVMPTCGASKFQEALAKSRVVQMPFWTLYLVNGYQHKHLPSMHVFRCSKITAAPNNIQMQSQPVPLCSSSNSSSSSSSDCESGDELVNNPILASPSESMPYRFSQRGKKKSTIWTKRFDQKKNKYGFELESSSVLSADFEEQKKLPSQQATRLQQLYPFPANIDDIADAATATSWNIAMIVRACAHRKCAKNDNRRGLLPTPPTKKIIHGGTEEFGALYGKCNFVEFVDTADMKNAFDKSLFTICVDLERITGIIVSCAMEDIVIVDVAHGINLDGFKTHFLDEADVCTAGLSPLAIHTNRSSKSSASMTLLNNYILACIRANNNNNDESAFYISEMQRHLANQFNPGEYTELRTPMTWVKNGLMKQFHAIPMTDCQFYGKDFFDP